MEVEGHHNFAVNGGFLVHNCDAIRYFIAGRPLPTNKPQPKPKYNFDFERPNEENNVFGGEPDKSYLDYMGG